MSRGIREIDDLISFEDNIEISIFYEVNSYNIYKMCLIINTASYLYLMTPTTRASNLTTSSREPHTKFSRRHFLLNFSITVAKIAKQYRFFYSSQCTLSIHKHYCVNYRRHHICVYTVTYCGSEGLKKSVTTQDRALISY